MNTTEEERKSIQIELSVDEALVFFDWLSRANDSEKLRFEH